MAHAEVPQLMMEIGALLGADRIRRPEKLELGAAEAIVEPRTIEELSELVRKCEADAITVAPIGACRTLAAIRQRPVRLGIFLRNFSEIVAYERDDLTVVVGAGCTIARLNQKLGVNRQRLPIDPSHPELTTVGAAIAAAHAGPLRLSQGLIRDLLIGVQFVTHHGRIVRGGGRVVKNVTGYDLMKVMTGSFGTLGVITEATFKVRPLPRRYALAQIPCESAAMAFALALKLNDLPLEHLEILSPGLARPLAGEQKYLLLSGLAGTDAELTYLCDEVHAAADNLTISYDDEALRWYEKLRDLSPQGELCVAVATRLTDLIEFLSPDFDFVAHAGSGVALVSPQSALDSDQARQWIAQLRSRLSLVRGNVRVITVPARMRGLIDVFERPTEGSMKLMARMKHTFDPQRIFNPGCFVGGL